jgi:hypothetical protein
MGYQHQGSLRNSFCNYLIIFGQKGVKYEFNDYQAITYFVKL